MFDYDKWQEIFSTIRKNKLRTALTMFGIFWGIFMILILTGTGNGLKEGVMNGFKGWSTNAGFIWTSRTTKPYNGFKARRKFAFDIKDVDILREQVDGIELIVGRYENWSVGGKNAVVFRDNSAAIKVQGEYPDYLFIESVNVNRGRFINKHDFDQWRKVAVIGKEAQKLLFSSGVDPIGKYVKFRGSNFKVVGIYESLREDERAKDQEKRMIIPASTFRVVMNRGDKLNRISYTARKGVSVQSVEDGIKRVLRERHQIHPEDQKAVGGWNFQKEVSKIDNLFNGISALVLFVGLGTLMAGIIGISNILLIVVRERTKEIGIRKSIGATPSAIIGLIMQESIFITAIAGYLGLFFGLGIIELLRVGLEVSGAETGMFKNPNIEPKTALVWLFSLLIAGVLAGIMPAIKATRINPIEALRKE